TTPSAYCGNPICIGFVGAGWLDSLPTCGNTAKIDSLAFLDPPLGMMFVSAAKLNRTMSLPVAAPSHAPFPLRRAVFQFFRREVALNLVDQFGEML
ncbi:hypothetical protein, partial [Phaeovulum sp.]|uniref:hypothetical protein n=1 Tax=Phaeovulum sp. TaxID=2934796 RepID=UPI0039E68E00